MTRRRLRRHLNRTILSVAVIWGVMPSVVVPGLGAQTPAVNETAILAASDGEADDDFGISAAIERDILVVGAYGDDDLANAAGAAYVYERGWDGWVERAKLLASDGAQGDRFGWAVDVARDRIVVGAFDAADGAGAAYVFVQSEGAWIEEARLTASDAEPGDEFGSSVAIDGDSVVVGARAEFGGAGAAYVFKRDGNTWTEDVKLVNSDFGAGDRFGTSVSVLGNTVAVGAPNHANDGAAYVYVQIEGVWYEEDKLAVPDIAASAGLGHAVALERDTVLVGALSDDGQAEGSGSVYVFTREGDGWIQESKLAASDGEGTDRFGGVVDIAGDIAVIGAFGDDDNGTSAGAAYMFLRRGGVWTEEAKLLASDGEAMDSFGSAVGVSRGTAVASSDWADPSGENSGAAYVFESFPAAGEGSITVADLDGDGRSDLVAEFGDPHGIWIWKNDAEWVPLHPFTPRSMVAGDVDGSGADEVVIDFGYPYGIWMWRNDTSWEQLHPLSPRSMVAGDVDGSGADEIVIDFEYPYGIWVWRNDTSWEQLHALSARSMVTGDMDGSGADEIVIDFGYPYGIWIRRNYSSWDQLDPASADTMAAGDLNGNGFDDILISFEYPDTTWLREDDSNWVPFAVRSDTLATGDLDGDGIEEAVADFGHFYGLWIYRTSGWSQLHELSP